MEKSTITSQGHFCCSEGCLDPNRPVPALLPSLQAGMSPPCPAGTYSTFLDHAGGLLSVINTQLVKMVIMMNMLNNLQSGQGELLWLLPRLPLLMGRKPRTSWLGRLGRQLRKLHHIWVSSLFQAK